MKVAIAGAHGQIALLLIPKLIANGHEVAGLVRKPGQLVELEALGAEAVLCDLETAAEPEIATAITGSDVAIFAAGAGAGSTAARKWTMDRDGAIKLADAARSASVDRLLVISTTGAEDPPSDDSIFSVYLRAKAEADQAVMRSELKWTIVRPGGLTDDPGTGCARIGSAPERHKVSRDDVAATLAQIVDCPETVGKVLYVNGGDHPIDAALRATRLG